MDKGGKVLTKSAADAVISFNIPTIHPCFSAHFPGNPIVPGALLVSWIISQIEQKISNTTVVGVKNIKFLQPVSPSDQCIINVSLSGDNRHLKIQCTVDNTIVCKGILQAKCSSM